MNMRTTIDIPDELFRRAKATAALEGRTLKDLVTEALEAHLQTRSAPPPEATGWRRCFGLLTRDETDEIDERIGDEFERIDPDEWS
jgi:hypothetical protein